MKSLLSAFEDRTVSCRVRACDGAYDDPFGATPASQGQREHVNMGRDRLACLNELDDFYTCTFVKERIVGQGTAYA